MPKRRGAPSVPLVPIPGEIFSIANRMTVEQISKGLAKSLFRGDTKVRKRIKQRLEDHADKGQIKAIPDTNPTQFSNAEIHAWLCKNLPEVGPQITNAPGDVTLPLTGVAANCFAGSLRLAPDSTMPCDLEGRSKLIGELARKLEDLQCRLDQCEAELAEKRTISNARQSGRGGRGRKE